MQADAIIHYVLKRPASLDPHEEGPLGEILLPSPERPAVVGIQTLEDSPMGVVVQIDEGISARELAAQIWCQAFGAEAELEEDYFHAVMHFFLDLERIPAGSKVGFSLESHGHEHDHDHGDHSHSHGHDHAHGPGCNH